MTPSSTSLARISRFVLVGTLGFLADAGMLWVGMQALGLGLYAGRVLSFAIAATFTWVLNRSFTFRDRRSAHPTHVEWLRYLAASGVGALANYGAYAACVATSAVVARHPTLGVAAGSLAGLVFNYAAYSRVVFRAPQPGLPSGVAKP